MLKRITLLILMVLNLSVYPQVVIKDEIILDETKLNKGGTESAGLTMPFYGKVTEKVYWYSIACGNGRTDLVVDGSYYPIGPCYNMNCGEENCFCQTGFSFQEIPDVPMGTTVDTKFQRCWIWGGSGNPPSWGDLEYYIDLIYSNENQWEYEARARMTENHPWEHAAYIYFDKTTPPGSGNCEQFECEEENFLPEVSLNQVPNGYSGKDACSHDEVTPAGVFKPFIVDDEEYIYNIEVCYNKQLQAWWFNLDNDHTFLVNYILEVCEKNLNKKGIELIYDYTGFPAGYSCDDMDWDLFSHYIYGFRVFPPPNYALEIIIRAHEEQHKSDFQILVNNRKNIIDNLLLEEIKDCESFSTQQEAQEYWEERIKYILGEFRDNLKKGSDDLWGKWGTEKREIYERITQGKIKWLVDSQILFTNREYGCSIDLIYFEP
jgi:hypothetical protein